MDDGESEFVYHLIIWIVWQCTSSVSGSVNKQINREWQRFSLNNKERKKGSKRIQMIIKMETSSKLPIVNFARPNQVQICARVWTKKIVENLYWAAGPSWAACH